MLIYEVNMRFDPSVREEYALIVEGHRERLLQLEGFESAELFKRRAADEGANEDGMVLWTMQYRVRNRQNLEAYFNTLAPELRAEARRFGAKVQVQRRILEFIDDAGSASKRS